MIYYARRTKKGLQSSRSSNPNTYSCTPRRQACGYDSTKPFPGQVGAAFGALMSHLSVLLFERQPQSHILQVPAIWFNHSYAAHRHLAQPQPADKEFSDEEGGAKGRRS